MKITNPDIPAEIKERFDAMMKFQESRRTQDEIISELALLIKDYRKDSFLPFVMEMMNHIDQRNSSEAYKHLMSPMKQFVYLIDLFFSVEISGTREGMSDEDWMKITILLNEIEMTYFGDIGFFKDGNEDLLDLEKVYVSLLAFLEYFGNAQLTFEEQTLERFERNCGSFDSDVKRLFGFSINDAKNLSIHIRNILNKKLTDCNYYMLHQEEWPILTSKFIERGVSDPRDWWNEPELAMLREYRTKPGYVFIHSIEDLKTETISEDILKKIILFLRYKEDTRKGTTVYYADKNPYFDMPLIELDSNYFLCPPYKFLIECFYNRINEALVNDLGQKYSQFKNQMLEKKVSELFGKLFGKDVQIFSSYYFDNKQTEQDILIRFKRFYFIIEVKDCLFRAPMRDPIKAFEKIKSDFKKSIQYGYNQCKRVEDKIAKGLPFKIYDHKTKKIIHEVTPSRIENYFSIVVTQFKYGGMQTNLQNLLKKDEEDLYPLSICVDDLEAFILILRKIKKGLAVTQFIEYLKYREPYHEHLICSDELELCGYFMNAPLDFKKYATNDAIFTTFAGMSDIFDAEYRNGLGFENELDQDIKKHYNVPKYGKNYDVTTIRGMDLME